MDFEEIIGTILTIFLVLLVIATVGSMIVDLNRNSSSDILCKTMGYDYGANLLWSNQTVCTRVIQEEKLEYFYIPNACK